MMRIPLLANFCEDCNEPAATIEGGPSGAEWLLYCIFAWHTQAWFTPLVPSRPAHVQGKYSLTEYKWLSSCRRYRFSPAHSSNCGYSSEEYLTQSKITCKPKLNSPRVPQECSVWIFFFTMAQQPPSGPRPHYRGFMISFRHTTFGRTPLDEWSARHRDFCPTNNTHKRPKHPCPRWDSNSQSQQASGSRPTP